MQVTAIIAAGGRGTRLGADIPKQLLVLGGRPMLRHSLDIFLAHPAVTDVVVAVPDEWLGDPPACLVGLDRVRLVAGGRRRQDSVANACAVMADRTDVVVIHDAARPLVTPDLISRTIDAAAAHGAAIAAVRATDTVKRTSPDGVIRETLRREEIFLAQTPQAFRLSVLRAALAVASDDVDATDEAALAEQAGHPVRVVEGDARNMKVTSRGDLDVAEQLLTGTTPVGGSTRVGIGYDLHRLVEGRPLILGGVTIPYEKGLIGHSDADVVCHAITDAVLGAAAAGDIGRHFPDTDPAWKGADSIVLLGRAMAIVRERGFVLENVDVVVIAERPKLAPHIDRIRERLAGALGVQVERVSVKGKTNEGVDSMGTGASIAAQCVAMLSTRTA